MLRVWIVVALVAGCSQRPSFLDCDIECAPESGCPSDLTCGAEGLCRTAGATATCGAVRDARDTVDANTSRTDGREGDPVDARADRVDARPDRVDARPDRPDARPERPDAAQGPSEYYGCFAVDDGAYNCAEICASESLTCSTSCDGDVWYAYSLAGPCAASQPAGSSGSSCTEEAELGTGDTIYVQCCCR